MSNNVQQDWFINKVRKLEDGEFYEIEVEPAMTN